MLRVESKDIERLHKFLTELDSTGPHAGKALPVAAKNGLNTSAFAARREWEKQGRKSMTVRNKWTFGGRHNRVKKARVRKSINQMEAVTGNTLRYVAQQERGFTKARPKGLQIPSKLSRIGKSMQRIVSRAHWRKGSSGMKMASKHYRYRTSKFAAAGRRAWKKRSGAAARYLGTGVSDGKAQYVAASIRNAKEAGATHVFLDTPNKRGIYQIVGKKLKVVWFMNKRFTSTKRNPMLARTIQTLKPYFPQYHRMALEEQIRFVAKKRGLNPRGSGLTGVSRLVP